MAVRPKSTSWWCAAGPPASKSVPPSPISSTFWESFRLTAKSERGTVTNDPFPKYIKTWCWIIISHTFQGRGLRRRHFLYAFQNVRLRLYSLVFVSSSRRFCLNHSMGDPPLKALCFVPPKFCFAEPDALGANPFTHTKDSQLSRNKCFHWPAIIGQKEWKESTVSLSGTEQSRGKVHLKWFHFGASTSIQLPPESSTFVLGPSPTDSPKFVCLCATKRDNVRKRKWKGVCMKVGYNLWKRVD